MARASAVALTIFTAETINRTNLKDFSLHSFKSFESTQSWRISKEHVCKANWVVDNQSSSDFIPLQKLKSFSPPQVSKKMFVKECITEKTKPFVQVNWHYYSN
ncbi:hypothetical protein OTU49_016192 [Cherax quadricarinatus]|uniref:Uncharacterized protein n=1 Tax=Cherax quadricarinatus TaxID=27406 RepID=A0AAW0XXX9_CHEQU